MIQLDALNMLDFSDVFFSFRGDTAATAASFMGTFNRLCAETA
jgi:hypothetical protein